MTDYKQVFDSIKQTKEKAKISNLLNTLTDIEPDESYIEELKELTNKVREIKIYAIGLLTNYNNKELEDFFIKKSESENDNFIVCRCIRGLNLNGSEKSAQFLLDFYKKTRSIDIKSEIIHTLRIINARNTISEGVKDGIYKLIGNEYPFFQGYWTDLKKAEKTTKENWSQIAEKQLNQNKLNLIFVENEKYDIHIYIEKMKKDFIRFINVYCIPKYHETTFSKYFTPSEFYISENRLFDSFFAKTKTMRPDNYVIEIINLINSELLPKLFSRVNMLGDLGNMKFEDFTRRENEIYDTLYGTSWDFVVSRQLTEKIDIFRDNPDKNKYIDLVIDKWVKQGKEYFSILDYLENQKNSR
ncbi:HEAT repeat domain-containing protein [Lacihabitans lacunae]|uniref:HEAT repeat domain-containing protein n=1 Tax=Lacihabitans lacunae TaxID=1028214 RepID=A0ABV7YU24_9BACT